MDDERFRIAPKFAATCELCHEPLDVRANGVHQWTSGWMKNRSGGGGHGVSCPVRELRWAHGQCVRDAVAGHTFQGTLL